MSFDFKFRKSWLGAAFGAVLAVGLGVCLHVFPVGLGLIHRSYDLPYAARPNPKPDEVIMVYMDDESHTKLGQRSDKSWDRLLHAQLVDRLTAANAKAVVFDIVFNDPSRDPAQDKEFSRAIKANGRVILAADTVPAGYGANVNMRTVTMPAEALRDAAAAIGSAETLPSEDFVIRQHFHGSRDDFLASISWTAASLVGAAATKDEEQRFVERWVNYSGPPGNLPSTAYYRALDTNVTGPEVFRDKVVFVGARLFTVYAGERKDEFRTPYSSWSKQNPFMPGVEVQATIFLNLWRGDWLTRWPVTTERILLIVLGAVVGFGLVQFRPLIASGAALICMILAGLLVYLIFRYQRIWFPWLIFECQIAVALLWSIVFNSIQLYVDKKLYEHTLALYLSPKLVKKFAKGSKLLKPGAEKQMLTILFSDIANFTSISEGMDSDELAKLMNNYFQRAVSECIHATDGTVVKYIGDAIFAFWNAPDNQVDHALRACEAALRFRDQGVQYINGEPLYTRIGLHTGVANVGNFGSTERVDYTALGENINLASRMEGLNKYLGTTLLATGETQAAVGDKMVSRFAGHFRLKGFEKKVEVYELIGRKDEAEGSRPWREAFAEALKHFERGDFEAAEAGFRNTLELRADDGPSKFYLKHIAEVRHHSKLENWTGEVELKEK